MLPSGSVFKLKGKGPIIDPCGSPESIYGLIPTDTSASYSGCDMATGADCGHSSQCWGLHQMRRRSITTYCIEWRFGNYSDIIFVHISQTQCQSSQRHLEVNAEGDERKEVKRCSNFWLVMIYCRILLDVSIKFSIVRYIKKTEITKIWC